MQTIKTAGRCVFNHETYAEYVICNKKTISNVDWHREYLISQSMTMFCLIQNTVVFINERFNKCKQKKSTMTYNKLASVITVLHSLTEENNRFLAM